MHQNDFLAISLIYWFVCLSPTTSINDSIQIQSDTICVCISIHIIYIHHMCVYTHTQTGEKLNQRDMEKTAAVDGQWKG